MKKIVKKGFVIALFALPGMLAVAETAEQGVVEYQHDGKQYPPVFFVTNIDNVDFKGKLDAYQAFSRLDSEAMGLPIGVRVLKGHRRKQDGTQFSTLMLSASTLGIIPFVSNTEFKVHYDVFVQGKSIAKFKYQVDSTDVNTIWASPHAERKTKPSEELFIEYTLPRFLSDLKDSSEVQTVFQEYWEYFED